MGFYLTHNILKNGRKKKNKTSPYSRSVARNALLMREATGEWSECFQLEVRLLFDRGT